MGDCQDHFPPQPETLLILLLEPGSERKGKPDPPEEGNESPENRSGSSFCPESFETWLQTGKSLVRNSGIQGWGGVKIWPTDCFLFKAQGRVSLLASGTGVFVQMQRRQQLPPSAAAV